MRLLIFIMLVSPILIWSQTPTYLHAEKSKILFIDFSEDGFGNKEIKEISFLITAHGRKAVAYLSNTRSFGIYFKYNRKLYYASGNIQTRTILGDANIRIRWRSYWDVQEMERSSRFLSSIGDNDLILDLK